MVLKDTQAKVAMAMAHVATARCAALIFLASIVFFASIKGGLAQKKERASVLDLFNLKEGSNFWDSDLLLKTVDDWQMSTKTYNGNTELDYYLSQGNLASYLNMNLIDALYLPIPINFIFIGFSGTGNHGIRLAQEDLKHWFENIDHILEHTRVPKNWETKKGAKTDQSDLPLISPVYYNYTVHALEMGQEVGEVFEKAIRVLGRKDNPDDKRSTNETTYQVDLEGMSQIIDNLISQLKLDSLAYNIIICNPNRENVFQHYGYRLGPSQDEVDIIGQVEEKRKQLLSPKLEEVPQMLLVDHVEMPLFDSNGRPNHKFAWRDIKLYQTQDWVKRYDKLLDGVQRVVNLPNPRDNSFRKIQQMLTGKVPKRSASLKKAIKAIPSGGWQSECLTDTWVASKRWAFLDLTAGPFSWGPLVGGENVRTETSLPSVEKAFRELKLDKQGLTDEDLEKDLEQLVEERFNIVEEDSAHEVDMLLAEIDVYEKFAKKHCKDRARKIPLCKELKERMRDMRKDLEKHKGGSDRERGEMARKALDKLHNWNIFGTDPLHSNERNMSRAFDSFLSNLGSTLSSAMRHLVTPSTSNGAYHFYEKVSFHIYLITQQTYYDKRRAPFDVSDLRDELAKLELSSQKFQFSTHKLSLADDPALALAYASALKSSMVQQIQENGTVQVKFQQSYLDSSVLQHQLQLLPDDSLRPVRKTKNERAILEIPIFVFAVSGVTVLIDESHVARGLSDMVVAVQLEESVWESPLQCNGNPLFDDLRNPVKAILGATMQHMAGLLPSHVSFSAAHGTPKQDWRWSVGGHPLSSTSREFQISDFLKDSVARSFVVTALEESLREINSAISLLGEEPTHEDTFRLFKRGHEGHLIASYNLVIEQWKEVAHHMERLDFSDATKMLPFLEERSRKFHRDVVEIVSSLHPLRCTRRRRVQMGVRPLVGILGTILLLVLCFVLRPQRRKPKVN